MSGLGPLFCSQVPSVTQQFLLALLLPAFGALGQSQYENSFGTVYLCFIQHASVLSHHPGFEYEEKC